MLEIKFIGMTPSPAVETAATQWMEWLERTTPRVRHCTVVIDLPHRRHRHGNRFQVRIEATAAGHDPVATRPHAHEDIYLALANAFSTIRRQLRERTVGHRRMPLAA